MTEQTVIPWDDVDDITPDGWVHAPTCRCVECKRSRQLLYRLRQWLDSMRCEADEATVRQRIRYYRKRARRGLPLFELSPRELRRTTTP